MFDRLVDAVGGDVALANVLAQKIDDFIAFSGEAKWRTMLQDFSKATNI